jgi:hypothetical protein
MKTSNKKMYFCSLVNKKFSHMLQEKNAKKINRADALR